MPRPRRTAPRRGGSSPPPVRQRSSPAGRCLAGPRARTCRRGVISRVPADQRRRVRAGDLAAEAGARRERTVEAERLGLALDVTGSSSSKSKMRSVAGTCVSDTATPSTGAAPCSREAVLTTSPAMIPSPNPAGPIATTVSPVLIPMRTCRPERRRPPVQLYHRLEDPQAGPDRALRVVLVRHGRAEDSHDRVTDELLHRPAEAARSPRGRARDTAAIVP